MSVFRINNNVMALGAMGALDATNDAFQKSVSKLSTGLRINSAADDPAGLIQSENFRAQISGITQALANSQDATNYVKTADASLGEVHTLLRDARTLAVAAANNATMSSDLLNANQSQLNSIVQTINRISTTTSFGTKTLLDGSSGTYAAGVSAAYVSGMSFGGMFNGAAVTQSSAVTVAVTTAATQAALTGSTTFAAATSTVAAGSFTINGVNFQTTSNQTVSQLVSQINNASGATGVTAAWAAGSGITLTSIAYGSTSKVQLTDANGVVNAAGATSNAGVDGVANVTISTAAGLATVAFNKGSGLNLKDNDGNTIALTAAGNATTAALNWGQVYVGTANFQIGGRAGQQVGVSIGNMGTSNLGANAVAGLNMSNLDLTSNASDAITVIDKAIADVSTVRASLGNIQRNVLESNIRSLSVARQSLTSTDSRIRDIDAATEISHFTSTRIKQQMGMSALAQANSAPQAVLSLLG
jgi:flagellin